MSGVILRLGTLPEPWESENTSKDLRRSKEGALLQLNLTDCSRYLG